MNEHQHIRDEIERLFPASWQAVKVHTWDIDPIKGFTMVALMDSCGVIYRGYAKRCNYAPQADKQNKWTGLSVALSNLMHRYGIKRKKDDKTTGNVASAPVDDIPF